MEDDARIWPVPGVNSGCFLDRNVIFEWWKRGFSRRMQCLKPEFRQQQIDFSEAKIHGRVPECNAISDKFEPCEPEDGLNWKWRLHKGVGQLFAKQALKSVGDEQTKQDHLLDCYDLAGTGHGIHRHCAIDTDGRRG